MLSYIEENSLSEGTYDDVRGSIILNLKPGIPVKKKSKKKKKAEIKKSIDNQINIEESF